MTNTDWHEWPQLEFDIDQFDDVQDWVVNRFGEDTAEVILVDKGSYVFHIAIQDPKIVNYALLKFDSCTLQPNQVNKDILAEEIRKQTDLELKRLITAIRDKMGEPVFDYQEIAAEEDTFFSYDNGVWTNVKE